MSQRTITLGRLMRESVAARLAEVSVSLPAKVVEYDAAKQTVKVQPLLKRKVRDAAGETTATEIPVLQAVPVAFPRCAGGWLTFPIAKDDVGMVVFCHRSIKDWMGKAAGEMVEPTDDEVLALNGAWFYPGGYPAASPLSGGADDENVVMHTGTKLDLGEKGLTDDDLVAIAKLVKAEISALQSTVNGNVTIYNAHVHPTGMGPSGPPAVPENAPAAVGEVKATKVRAK